MIVRIWRGEATQDNADAYHRHVTTRVFPGLASIPGHRGATLLRREAEGRVEFLAVTLWESMDAVRQFAGSAPDRAVVEPEARAVLAAFDDVVRHYEVAHGTVTAGKKGEGLVVCIRNDGHPASLELRKIYRTLADREAEKHAQLRVIDESGEDYLYPAAWFMPIDLPDPVRRAVPETA